MNSTIFQPAKEIYDRLGTLTLVRQPVLGKKSQFISVVLR